MSSQFLPVIAFLEQCGGECLLRELNHFSVHLLSEMERKGKIHLFKEGGLSVVEMMSCKGKTEEVKEVEVKPQVIRKPSSLVTKAIREKKKPPKPPKPPKSVKPVSSDGETPKRNRRASKKDAILLLIKDSPHPLTTTEIHNHFPDIDIDGIRFHLRMLSEEGVVISNRKRNRYFTLADNEGKIEGYDIIRVANSSKRDPVVEVLGNTESALSVQDIYMKCSENKKPVSLETIRYILKYLIHHEQVILYRQNNNARYYYALTSNDRAVEALRKQEEDYLPNKIVRYLHDNGSKHQALISENVIGDRRPTKYLIEILRKMRDEGIVVTQSVGSCIFYSLNQPYICDRRQVC